METTSRTPPRRVPNLVRRHRLRLCLLVWRATRQLEPRPRRVPNLVRRRRLRLCLLVRPPTRRSEPRPRRRCGRHLHHRGRLRFLAGVSVGFAVLALGVLGLFDSAVPGFDPQLRHYVALLVAVIGVGLVVGAWFGRTRGLTVLGVVLLPILVLSPLQVDERSSIDFDFATVGQAQHRPGSGRGDTR